MFLARNELLALFCVSWIVSGCTTTKHFIVPIDAEMATLCSDLRQETDVEEKEKIAYAIAKNEMRFIRANNRVRHGISEFAQLLGVSIDNTGTIIYHLYMLDNCTSTLEIFTNSADGAVERVNVCISERNGRLDSDFAEKVYWTGARSDFLERYPFFNQSRKLYYKTEENVNYAGLLEASLITDKKECLIPHFLRTYPEVKMDSIRTHNVQDVSTAFPMQLESLHGQKWYDCRQVIQAFVSPTFSGTALYCPEKDFLYICDMVSYEGIPQ